MQNMKFPKTPFWGRVKELMNRSSRQRRGVNLSRLSIETKADETVVVVDKVLGTGVLKHPLTVVAAEGLSASASAGLKAAGAKVVALPDFASKNPSGKDVRIFI